MPLLNEKVLNNILTTTPLQSSDAKGPNVTDKLMEATVIKICDNFVEPYASPVKQKSIPERIPAFGLIMAILSVICFSLGSVIVKLLTELHSIEVLVFRALFQLVFYAIVTLIYRYPIFGVKGHRIDLALRAVSGTVSLTTIFIAYRLMPLGDASTIHFASPVFVTIFAFFILREKITILQAVTGVITLAGVVIIAKPEFIFGSESSDIHEYRVEGTILAVVAALAAAFSMIFLRKLKTTPPSVVVMWFASTSIASGLIILYIMNAYVWPTQLRTWILLINIGLCGIGDQYFLCLALRYESAGPVSITRTFNIVLSFIWEVTILAEVIEWSSILGASLVSSCVLIMAIVKWKHESPSLFENLNSKLFGCCTKRDHIIESVPETRRPSLESIDSRIVQSTVNSNVILLNDDDKS